MCDTPDNSWMLDSYCFQPTHLVIHGEGHPFTSSAQCSHWSSRLIDNNTLPEGPCKHPYVQQRRPCSWHSPRSGLQTQSFTCRILPFQKKKRIHLTRRILPGCARAEVSVTT